MRSSQANSIWIKHKSLSSLMAILLLTAVIIGIAYSGINDDPQSAAAETPFTDFNGDGYSDLAIGVPGRNSGDSPGEPGSVNVIYGSSAGLAAPGNQM